jgi:nucleoside-diphosphate-sugar epimerase
VLGDRVAEVLRAADVEATFAKLAWKPAVPLDEGLARTIRWFGDDAAAKHVATEG